MAPNDRLIFLHAALFGISVVNKIMQTVYFTLIKNVVTEMVTNAMDSEADPIDR